MAAIGEEFNETFSPVSHPSELAYRDGVDGLSVPRR